MPGMLTYPPEQDMLCVPGRNNTLFAGFEKGVGSYGQALD